MSAGRPSGADEPPGVDLLEGLASGSPQQVDVRGRIDRRTAVSGYPRWFLLGSRLPRCVSSAAVLYRYRLAPVGSVAAAKSWARAHGFDDEQESTEIVVAGSGGVMSTVGDVTARNVVLAGSAAKPSTSSISRTSPRSSRCTAKVGNSKIVMDLRPHKAKEPRETTLWLLGMHRPSCCINNLDAARRACDCWMVTFAHTARRSAPRLGVNDRPDARRQLIALLTCAQWTGIACRNGSSTVVFEAATGAR